MKYKFTCIFIRLTAQKIRDSFDQLIANVEGIGSIAFNYTIESGTLELTNYINGTRIIQTYSKNPD